jgi:hypothetical protein
MVVPKTVNGITIQDEDIQQHNHPSSMVMPKTFNGLTIQVEWLCQKLSTA